MEPPRSQVPPTSTAKGALRRLAQSKLEPTPENYARAYAEELGQPPPVNEAKAQGAAWAALVERLVRHLDRGGRQWTMARRKDSLRRVLDSSRSDAQRLLQRLQSLLSAWESDQPADPAQTGVEDPPIEAPVAPPAGHGSWTPALAHLEQTVRAGLAGDEPRASELAHQLGRLADALAGEGITAGRLAELDALCTRARRLFAHRHHLVEELAALCRELGAGLVELSEDESWAQGQCRNLQARLADDLSVRSVRAAASLLAETRGHQQTVRGERQAARDALKQLIHDMLVEVGELGETTGRFTLATERHAEAIESADTLESLAGVVKAMLADSRAVQQAVAQSQERLQADRGRAGELEDRVRQLEAELLRLSDEVSTDALTQVANRRGLTQQFEAESARALRSDGAELSVALIDIDNFKRLNDSLGHTAGDQALKTLAAAVRERLRPVDHLARFGGEEFVVLLPATAVAEAQQTLTRLQRSLSEALFMYDGREVFVTFSAGVTAWQVGEALETTLERADEALYEAKRTGKNRTCIA
ncbi:GGDEF domain-containing protein [Rubrivivax sp. A210]|uniref:GGDEF domain-containing protein n=1 Tax=Rubrivivax sp. A210 TaxID=2772301 RepID=UPI001994B010|nr:GGDEF domain-containing protein [Rubrivivax sp. A210]CAD5374731.1 GGDEF domain-containing protein [Rubrivivax sp. A210]